MRCRVSHPHSLGLMRTRGAPLPAIFTGDTLQSCSITRSPRIPAPLIGEVVGILQFAVSKWPASGTARTTWHVGESDMERVRHTLHSGPHSLAVHAIRPGRPSTFRLRLNLLSTSIASQVPARIPAPTLHVWPGPVGDRLAQEDSTQHRRQILPLHRHQVSRDRSNIADG